MLELSITFEEFQLVLNFVLFFTLPPIFSIHEKYKLAKIWRGLQPPKLVVKLVETPQKLLIVLTLVLTSTPEMVSCQ